MKAVSRPILNVIKSRSYAAQAGVVSANKPSTTVTVDHEGTKVLLKPSSSGLKRISFVYKAGARYEDADNVGMTHVIRAATCAGAFLMPRMLGVSGQLTCTTSREHIIYTYETNCTVPGDLLLDAAHNYLKDVSRMTCELPDITEPVKLDIATLQAQPHVQVSEIVHKAAYRNGGLGNSNYMSPNAVNGISFEKVNAYARKVLTGENLALIIRGFEPEDVQELLSNWDFDQGPSLPVTPSKYGGGEVRVDNTNDVVHAAIVTEGVSLTSNELHALCVLQRVMGVTPRIKYQTFSSSLIGKALSTAGLGQAQASAFNTSYSDSGLFGFQMAAHYKDSGKVLKELVSAFASATKGSITDAEVKKAKAQLKVDLMSEVESETAAHEYFCTQAFNAQVSELADCIHKVDAVTTQQVQAIAKKVINSKPSMAAIGNLSCTPYLDELL